MDKVQDLGCCNDSSYRMDKVQDLSGCFSLKICGFFIRVFPTPHIRILVILWLRVGFVWVLWVLLWKIVLVLVGCFVSDYYIGFWEVLCVLDNCIEVLCVLVF